MSRLRLEQGTPLIKVHTVYIKAKLLFYKVGIVQVIFREVLSAVGLLVSLSLPCTVFFRATYASTLKLEVKVCSET